MTRKKPVFQALDEQPQAPSDILTITETKPAAPIITREQLEKIMGKFPEYPNLSNRHPETIERFIDTYNTTLQELKQAIQQMA